MQITECDRNHPRVQTPKLSISLCCDTFKPGAWYSSVEIPNISHGGIGIVVQDLLINQSDNVLIHLSNNGVSLQVRGIVVYRYPNNGMFRYGIVFTEAHPKLAELIDTLEVSAALFH